MRTAILAAAIASFGAIHAHAEDRSGFYFGGGLGAHLSNLKAEQNGLSGSETNLGWSTSFKMGGYVTPTLALYFVREAVWWSDEDLDGDVLVTGLSGIGSTYYFNTGDSFYLEAGVGVGDFENIATGEAESGIGAMFGAGYEFSDHFQVGLVALNSVVEGSDVDGDYTASNLAFVVKLEAKL